MYKDLLTEAQYNWLLNNQNIWFNTITVLWYSDSSKGVVVCQLLSGPIYRFYTIDTNGVAGSVSTGTTGFEIYTGIKTGGIYLYSDNGIFKVDSRDTIGIPLNTPLNNRYDFDYLRIKDSKWLPVNMYNVINNLSEVKVIPKEETSKFNLALKWDSNMAEKYMSPYLYQWTLGSINEFDIALSIKTLYLDKWNKMYEALMAEYNPIDNYNITETREISETDNSESNSRSESTGNNTGNSSSTNNQTGSTDDDVYAFNSESATKDRRSNSSNNVDGTSEYADNTSNNSNSNMTSNRTNNVTNTRNGKGNIGVTTSQKMITEELELRKYILLDDVFNDICNELTLRIY